MEAVFPLWKQDTQTIAKEFKAAGFKSVIVCVDINKISKDMLGAEFEDVFIAALDPSVDICGENGEFHTFTYDGPLFKTKIDFEIQNGSVI